MFLTVSRVCVGLFHIMLHPAFLACHVTPNLTEMIHQTPSPITAYCCVPGNESRNVIDCSFSSSPTYSPLPPPSPFSPQASSFSSWAERRRHATASCSTTTSPSPSGSPTTSRSSPTAWCRSAERSCTSPWTSRGSPSLPNCSQVYRPPAGGDGVDVLCSFANT